VDLEEFCTLHPVIISERSGIGLDTVYRHCGMICSHLDRQVPKKVTKLQLEKGKKELLSIRGVTETMIVPLLLAGIVDIAGLLAADPTTAGARSGIPAESIRAFQAVIKKRLAAAVIQL
jgi:hypothetical protein